MYLFQGDDGNRKVMFTLRVLFRVAQFVNSIGKKYKKNNSTQKINVDYLEVAILLLSLFSWLFI